MRKAKGPAAPAPWTAWIEGITNRSPTNFDSSPNRESLLKLFTKTVRQFYALPTDEKALDLAENLGLRLALKSTREKMLVYYKLDELQATARRAR